MGAFTQTIVISGYYGFGNSGDEAVLQSILLALEEQQHAGVRIEPVVLSANPEETARMYGVRAVHRWRIPDIVGAVRSSDGLISGGGSLLQDATGVATIPYYLGIVKLAQWLGKPTFIYSQGIGPVNRSLFHPLIRHVFRKCRYISVRDAESAELLARMGLPPERVDVVPDPVMGLKLRAQVVKQARDLPVVGISVRFWNKDRSELEGLATALDQLSGNRRVELRFLPFHQPADQEASSYVMSRLKNYKEAKVSLISDAVHPRDMLAEVSQCDVLIGMRLHSLIYAASQSIPVVGISYDPKIDQFLNRLDMKAAASTSRLDPEALSAETVRLMDGKAQWISDKRQLIENLIRQSGQPAQQIAAYLRNKG